MHTLYIKNQNVDFVFPEKFKNFLSNLFTVRFLKMPDSLHLYNDARAANEGNQKTRPLNYIVTAAYTDEQSFEEYHRLMAAFANKSWTRGCVEMRGSLIWLVSLIKLRLAE